MADQSKKDTANAEFKKAQRAEAGKKAMSDYEAEAAAERAKTARLRAARLARDAELGAVPKAPVAPKKRSAKAGKGTQDKGASAKLADWLDDQQKSGRNS